MGLMDIATTRPTWPRGAELVKTRNSQQVKIFFPEIQRIYIFNRPSVAGAVLQKKTFVSHELILSVSHPLWKYLQNTVSPMP